MNETNNIIISGSGGMLGNELLKVLSGSNFEVFAFSSQKEKLAEKFSNLENIHLCDNSELNTVKLDNGIWLNCSFPRSSLGKELATSFNFTIDMIDRMSTINCAYMINISSQSVYSQQGDAFPTEKTKVSPENLYGMTKYAIEKMCELKCKENNMNIINVRLGSLAGPKFNERMINRFIDLVLNKQAITIDSGSPKVSYLHVHDAAIALVKLVEKINHNLESNVIPEKLNLGNNDYMEVKLLAENIHALAQKSDLKFPPIIFNQKKSNYNNVICSDAYYKLTNWMPEYTMKKLINEIWQYKMYC